MQVKSRTLSKEDPAPNVVGFDIQVPNGPLNPSYYGAAELSIDAPSVGIYSQFLGHVELTGFPTGAFQRVEFALPQSIKTKLGGNYTDLTLRIALNVTNGEPKKYLLDHFTFGPALPTCTPQSDGNPCTDDVCLNGVPAWPLKAAGTACDTNATVCDGTGACNATGTCVLGTVPQVDDGNPCTTDACDPVSGVTHVAKAAGTSCANSTVCDGAETCSAAGLCVQGTPPSVDDGNTCTDDSCDALAGVIHTPRPAGTSCNDANVCNGSEVCSAAGTCLPGTAVTVPPSTACVSYVCDPVAGVVATNKPQGSACDDATVCNGHETCNGSGSCTAGTPPVIPPSTACAVYACDATAGIVVDNQPSGTSCANGTVCDGAETCNGAGSCAPGTPISVPPPTPCATFSCNPVSGLVASYKPSGTACLDGDACNGAEACNGNGICAAGTPLTIPPSTACTTYGCDPMAGVVSSNATPGTACDDQTLCNGHETCDGAGYCAGGSPVVIDDGNPCTADSCDPVTGVAHATMADGTSCDDATACNGHGMCQGGICASGTPIGTDDGNPCTLDTCDPATGVVTHVPQPAGAACDPIDACHDDGTCDERGQCLPGEALSFDDGDLCTIETCDPIAGLTRRQCGATDTTVATVVADANAWIYSGANPLQTGVAPGTIARNRGALVTGRVLSAMGLPLGGAAVSVLNHPELGETVTQTNRRVHAGRQRGRSIDAPSQEGGLPPSRPHHACAVGRKRSRR